MMHHDIIGHISQLPFLLLVLRKPFCYQSLVFTTSVCHPNPTLHTTLKLAALSLRSGPSVAAPPP